MTTTLTERSERVDASILIAGAGAVGSLGAVAVAMQGRRNDSDRVKVEAWVAHNKEQEERITDLKDDIIDLHKEVEGLREEVALCHKEKDEQRDEMGGQILALKRRLLALEDGSP